MTEDEQSIRALVATWHSSTAAGNVDGVLQLRCSHPIVSDPSS